MLASKNILVGITGGIAAYKVAELVRLLMKSGANVQVVMTEGAKAFITPLTLQALSGRPVRDSLLDPAAEAGMGHIELARWADLLVVAPATADFIARYRAGLANDLLTTLCLARRAPLVIVPAMNQAMWLNRRTQENMHALEDELTSGELNVWGPAEGNQACGDNGPGRMLEAVEIFERIQQYFTPVTDLSGRRVVITAGPTREAIDPVRYISNHSSGKMGYALAEAAVRAGAEVVLVSGPVSLACPDGVSCVRVESAESMLSAVQNTVADGCDLFIAAAAVADYRPLSAADQKMKKQGDDGVVLQLTQNPDIVATVAANKGSMRVVGFAAETQNVETYAKSKLERKNLDVIVANDVSDQNIGFNSEQNAVTVYWKDNSQGWQEKRYQQQDKKMLADALIGQFKTLFLK